MLLKKNILTFLSSGKTKKLLLIGALFFLLVAGIFVRYATLSSHFTHHDDLAVAVLVLESKKITDIDRIRLYLQRVHENRGALSMIGFLDTEWFAFLLPFFQHIKPFVAVPLATTYAPFQFLLTPFFISEYQSYREILFWGRFPSFLFGSMGLVALLLLYAKFFPGRTLTDAILPLTLLAFSWENIIYAQQMESYAIGVFAVLCLLILLLYLLAKPSLSLKTLLFSSLTLAVLSSMQYQILFFVLAFYVTLIIKIWEENRERIHHIKNLSLSLLAYVVLISPILFFFLLGKINAGVNYGAGLHNEFLFSLIGKQSLLEILSYTFSFFTTNIPLVFQSMIAFAPKVNTFFVVLSWLLFLLFLAGCVSLGFSRGKSPGKKEHSIQRLFSFFLLFVLITWISLILAGKLTLSPTRHSLILLPLFTIFIGEGVRRIIQCHKNFFLLGIVCCILFSFGINYHEVIKKRKDLFEEKDIQKIITSHTVDVVRSADYNLRLMKLPCDFNGRFSSFYEWSCSKQNKTPKTIAFISKDHFIMEQSEVLLQSSNLIYSKKQISNENIDFDAPIIEDSKNSLFINIYRQTSE